MKYYKLSMDMKREKDIVCHYKNDFGIQQNELNVGKPYKGWDGKFEFYYDKQEIISLNRNDYITIDDPSSYNDF